MVLESFMKTVKHENLTYEYVYKLTQNEIALNSGNDDITVTSYGIEVERRDISGNTVVNLEKDSIKNISPQRHKVHSVLKLLYENTVSPIHLVDIAGQYADEYVEDFDKEIIANQIQVSEAK